MGASGDNVINMNISFDAMPAETTLKFKLGSHRRGDPLSIGPTFVPGVEGEAQVRAYHQIVLVNHQVPDRRRRHVHP